MFKSIARNLESKLEFLSHTKEKEYKIKDALQTFFKVKGYPEAEVIYDQNENQVLIETVSKVFATELTFCLGEITQLLLKENVKINKIIIR